MSYRFWSKTELVIRFGIRRETLQLHLKKIQGLETGRK